MKFEARTTANAGVTLVAIQLRNDETSQRRVRVRNELDGDVWPPRTNDVPDEGWDEEGWDGVVPADGTLALGYATPGRPATPAVTVTAARADSTASSGTLDPVRGLPDPRPPRDVLPASVPSAVDSWLDDVERRVKRGATGEREREVLARAARLRARCRR